MVGLEIIASVFLFIIGFGWFVITIVSWIDSTKTLREVLLEQRDNLKELRGRLW